MDSTTAGELRRASRWPAIVLALLAIAGAAGIGANEYLDGGGRILALGGSAAGPVLPGDDMHFLLPIRVAGGEVELRSIHLDRLRSTRRPQMPG